MTVVKCPICGNSAKVDAELHGGETFDCPYCNREFTYHKKSEHINTPKHHAKRVHITPNKNTNDNTIQLAICCGSGAGIINHIKTLLRVVLNVLTFKKWIVELVNCPKCKRELFLYCPDGHDYRCKCLFCDILFTKMEGATCRDEVMKIASKDLNEKLEKIDTQVLKIDSELESLKKQKDIWTLWRTFDAEVKRFEDDWALSRDTTFPQRGKMVIDGLYARLNATNMAMIANGQKHAAAENLMYGNTIGLRDPHSTLYKFARDLVQWKGIIREISALDEAKTIDEQLYLINSNIANCEKAMTYYYDLCSEFDGLTKDEAYHQRMTSVCGCVSKDQLPQLPALDEKTVDSMHNNFTNERTALTAARDRHMDLAHKSENLATEIQRFLNGIASVITAINFGLIIYFSLYFLGRIQGK